MAPRHPSFVSGTPCPQCGEEIPSEAPEGLCPRCLFAAAVTAPRDPIEDADEDDQAIVAEDEECEAPEFGLTRTARTVSSSFDFAFPAARYQPTHCDPARSLDAMFNRSWALNILELVLRRVRQDWAAAGRADEFDRLKYALVGDSAADGQQSVGEHGPTSAGSLSPVSLLRRGFHQRLREEVARTVASPDDVDDEIWDLFRALQS
jgi:hypothetical protein